eukprot:6965930-Prymnesium_polylepis.1
MPLFATTLWPLKTMPLFATSSQDALIEPSIDGAAERCTPPNNWAEWAAWSIPGRCEVDLSSTRGPKHP